VAQWLNQGVTGSRVRKNLSSTDGCRRRFGSHICQQILRVHSVLYNKGALDRTASMDRSKFGSVFARARMGGKRGLGSVPVADQDWFGQRLDWHEARWAALDSLSCFARLCFKYAGLVLFIRLFHSIIVCTVGSS